MKYYYSGAFLCASLGGVALIGTANGKEGLIGTQVDTLGFSTALNSGIVPTPIVENTFLVQLPSTFDIKTMNECKSYDVDEEGMVPHEQVLGCSLFHGIATMGAYKADEDLNKRPTETPLTGALFDTTGIAEMILDGCFSVSLVKSLQDNSFAYSTLQTYESQVSNSYSLDVSAKASYAQVAASTGYQRQTDSFVQENGVNQASGGEKYSEYIYARLRNQCIKDGSFRTYMTVEAQSVFNDMTEDPAELAPFKLWKEKYGLVVPSVWYFGAYRAFSSKVTFVSTETVQSYESAEAMNSAMSVDAGSYSADVAVKMQTAFASKMSTFNSNASLSVESSSNSNCPAIWDSTDRATAIEACSESLSNVLNWGTSIKVGQFTPVDYGVTKNKEEMAYTMYGIGAKCFVRSNHFLVQEMTSGQYLSCVGKSSDSAQGCAWKSYIDQTFQTTIRDPSWSGFKLGFQAFDIEDNAMGWLDRGHCHASTSTVRLSGPSHCGSKHWGIKASKYLCEDGKNGNNCMTKDAHVSHNSWLTVETPNVYGLMVDFNGYVQRCCPAGMTCP